MTDPTVACILLTRDRPEYARRAVECFRAQTYPYGASYMAVYDTGDPAWFMDAAQSWDDETHGLIMYSHQPQNAGMSVGALRNEANSLPKTDIMIHWDSDDWSHPNHIAEQVALLQSSGADCVGYREVLFWRTGRPEGVHSLGLDRWQKQPCTEGSYLYTNNDPRYCIGSSFCYWRKAWEARPFEDVMREEDGRWLKGVRSVGVSANHSIGFRTPMQDVTMGGLFAPADVLRRFYPGFPEFHSVDPIEPRMICRVHAGNAKHYPLDELVQTCPSSWRRVPEWDTHCHEVMG